MRTDHCFVKHDEGSRIHMGEVSFNQSNHRICFINLVRVIQIIIIIIIIIIIVFNKS